MVSMMPDNFVWGAGSSAYQIEGGHDADGREPSVWDTFCRRDAAVHAGHTGDVACDHYNLFKDDVALMRRIGLKAYRFSISWPRVAPLCGGSPNAKGLAFYDRLVDELLAAGIRPWATLFHWDFPQALFNRGGWLNRDSAQWFAEYAAVVADRLSDRVTDWMTLNEPQVYIGLGHGDAKHAPGLRLTFGERLLASHHTLLAHGRAVMALRARAKRPLSIGWAPVGHVTHPATEHEANIAAARSLTFDITRQDLWNNTWFADPVCLGHYPEDGLRLFHPHLPPIPDGDLEVIHQKIDFYGVNIYMSEAAQAGPDATGGKPQGVPREPGHPQTAFRWSVGPEGLYWGPRFIHERYKLPVVVTENGMSNIDWVDLDGRVRDPQRIDYTRRYLQQLRRAASDGVKVAGYFHWSIMDNFEWAEGYKERFGLIHVDYRTLKRTMKDSAHWYARVIATNGASLDEPADPQRFMPSEAAPLPPANRPRAAAVKIP